MNERFTVAIVGGGQLARMMHEAGSALGLHLRALVEAADGSAGQVIPGALVGSAHDEAAVRAVAAGAYALTVEHEHVDIAMLRRLQAEGLRVHPGGDPLVYAQDKLAMRSRLAELSIPQPAWAEVRDAAGLREFAEGVGWPVVVKTTKGGYDGKGVRLANLPDDAADWLAALSTAGSIAVDGLGGHGGHALLVEERVPYTRELTALVARRGGPEGEIRFWPVAETVQEGGVCREVLVPAPGLHPELAAAAQRIAAKIARGLGVVGVLAVELFVVEEPEVAESRLLVNELAMRPHNSGHWSIDGAVTSQFEQHLRAVLELPLGSAAMRAEHCVMVNLLGSELADPREAYERVMERFPDAKVHLYGKAVRPGRKLGHVTMCGSDLEELRVRANAAVALLRGD